MDIISVQSRVVWGYVGNAVAVPTAHAFGIDAWPVDTIRLAHHPGHGPTWRSIPSAVDVTEMLRAGFARAGTPTALLLGYLGDAAQGIAVIDVFAGMRAGGVDVPLYLDPAFGDDKEGVYVADDIVRFYGERALPLATVVMPNRFELAQLADMDVESADDAMAAAGKLIARGAKSVLASSVPVSDGRLGNLLVGPDGAWIATVPKLDLAAKGTGDMLSAAFTAAMAAGHGQTDALGLAVGCVQAAAGNAAKLGLVELDVPRTLRHLDDTPSVEVKRQGA